MLTNEIDRQISILFSHFHDSVMVIKMGELHLLLNERTFRKKFSSFPSELDLVRRADSLFFCPELLHPFGERKRGFHLLPLLFHHHSSSFCKPVSAFSAEKRGTHRHTEKEPDRKNGQILRYRRDQCNPVNRTDKIVPFEILCSLLKGTREWNMRSSRSAWGRYTRVYKFKIPEATDGAVIVRVKHSDSLVPTRSYRLRKPQLMVKVQLHRRIHSTFRK